MKINQNPNLQDHKTSDHKGSADLIPCNPQMKGGGVIVPQKAVGDLETQKHKHVSVQFFRPPNLRF